jgi:hypothetical protein
MGTSVVGSLSDMERIFGLAHGRISISEKPIYLVELAKKKIKCETKEFSVINGDERSSLHPIYKQEKINWGEWAKLLRDSKVDIEDLSEAQCKELLAQFNLKVIEKVDEVGNRCFNIKDTEAGCEFGSSNQSITEIEKNVYYNLGQVLLDISEVLWEDTLLRDY